MRIRLSGKRKLRQARARWLLGHRFNANHARYRHAFDTYAHLNATADERRLFQEELKRFGRESIAIAEARRAAGLGPESLPEDIERSRSVFRNLYGEEP